MSGIDIASQEKVERKSGQIIMIFSQKAHWDWLG